jgi:hypothetical protein
MSEQGPDQQLPTVPEVILSSASLLVSLAAESLQQRRLDDASLAIDGVRALMPQVEKILPPDAAGGYRQALSDLQLAFASVAGAGGQPGGGAEEGGREPPAPPRQEPPPAQQRAPRPRIWTPGGDV